MKCKALVGLYRRPKRLADGSLTIYYYAWRGGPRIMSAHGTADFVAEFHQTVATKIIPPVGKVPKLLRDYEFKSTEFAKLKERTKADYRKHLTKLEDKCRDMPIKFLERREARGFFKRWFAELAKESERQAQYTLDVTKRVFSVAKDSGDIRINPVERMGRIYDGNRREKIWVLEDEAAFLKVAPWHLAFAFMMALWSGQRQGDLLRLTWSAYDGNALRVRQSKSDGVRRKLVYVTVPVAGPLKVMLDGAKARRGDATNILTTEDGLPWTPGKHGTFDGFHASWRKACIKAGLMAERGNTDNLHFNDLRGTAVTRLALSGCTEAQIASITGHTLAEVKSILDAHYLHRDPELARQAIHKLELRYANGPESLPAVTPVRRAKIANVVALRTPRRGTPTAKQLAKAKREARLAKIAGKEGA
jgi:integrase